MFSNYLPFLSPLSRLGIYFNSEKRASLLGNPVYAEKNKCLIGALLGNNERSSQREVSLPIGVDYHIFLRKLSFLAAYGRYRSDLSQYTQKLTLTDTNIDQEMQGQKK